MDLDQKVDILLATFNGEKFLEEQLDSILSQSWPNTTIIAGDDASDDKTLAILRRYADRCPEKMLCIPYKERVGVIENFSRLAELSDAPYIMFCDQDDRWHKEKVAIQLNRLRELEAQYGKDLPLAVFSDAALIDETGDKIAISYARYSVLNPERLTLPRLLMQTPALACTFMINRACLELAFPIPVEADMHDYWVALVAGFFGRLSFIDKPLIDYRTHGSNAVGAYSHEPIKQFFQALRDPGIVKSLNRRVYSKMLTALTFYRRYGSMMDEEQKSLVKAFIEMKNKGVLQEMQVRLKKGFFRGKVSTYFLVLLLSGPLNEQYRLNI